MHISVHCFFSNPKSTHKYWIEHLFQESIHKVYLYNVAPDFKKWLDTKKYNVSIQSSYDANSKHMTTQELTDAKNNSVQLARKDKMNWLLFLDETDLLDIRTKTDLPAVMKSIGNDISVTNLNVYEVIKTLNPSADYNYFINEEYAYSDANAFLNDNNISLVSNKKKLGNRLLVNLNAKSLHINYNNTVVLKDVAERGKYNRFFNLENRAWRVLSYSSCDFQYWKKHLSEDTTSSDDDLQFLYNTTVLLSEETAKKEVANGKAFIIDEAQIMNVNLSPPSGGPNEKPKPTPNSSSNNSKVTHNNIPSLNSVELLDMAIPLVKTILEALEFRKKSLQN